MTLQNGQTHPLNTKRLMITDSGAEECDFGRRQVLMRNIIIQDQQSILLHFQKSFLEASLKRQLIRANFGTRTRPSAHPVCTHTRTHMCIYLLCTILNASSTFYASISSIHPYSVSVVAAFPTFRSHGTGRAEQSSWSLANWT